MNALCPSENIAVPDSIPPAARHRKEEADSRAQTVIADRSHRLFGLDVIRATAILMVVFSHTIPEKAILGVPVEFVSRFRVALGLMGVELFFVLSGFLIGGILLRDVKQGRLETATGLADFWKRRWFRTLPAYLLFLFIHALLQWRETGVVPGEWWRFLTFTQSFVQAHPQWFREAWSLAVEEWFYLLFPLSLFFTRKACRNDSRSFICCALVFLVVPVALRCADWGDGFGKITVLRLDAIMFGVVLAYIAQQKPSLWNALRRGWIIGLAATVGVVLLLSAHKLSHAGFMERVFLFACVSFGLSLLLPVISHWQQTWACVAAPIGCLSRWSYSLYLCHGIVNAYFRPVVLNVTGMDVGRNSLVRFCGVVSCAIIMAALIYRFFEKPAMDLRDRC